MPNAWEPTCQELTVETVVIPFAFRRSLVIEGCHRGEDDEDTQGGHNILMQFFFNFAKDDITQAI